jgi:hypothetical protein
MEESVVFKYYKKIKEEKEEVDPLENYVEIPARYLRFLQGCWVKWKKPGQNVIAGIVNLVEGTRIFIRQIKNKERIEFDIADNTLWYCKKDSENYRAILEIQREYEKLKTFF